MVGFLRPFGQHDQESRDLLPGALAAQKNHPFARHIQLIQRPVVKRVAQHGVFFYQLAKSSGVEQTDFDFRHRLAEDLALPFANPAKKVRWKKQSDDLLTPVAKRLGELDHASDDRADDLLVFRLGDDDLTGLKNHVAGNGGQLGLLVQIQDIAYGAVAHHAA